jgi:hypothetical protein
MCTPLHDIHASDIGYEELADLVFAASGFRSEHDSRKDR